MYEYRCTLNFKVELIIEDRLDKAQDAFRRLSSIWKSRQLTQNTNISL